MQRDTASLQRSQPIFQLTDADGNVYVVQSYAQIVDETLIYEQLPSLADKAESAGGLDVVRPRRPNKTSRSSPWGIAHVVNDELANSYQRRDQSRPCLRRADLASARLSPKQSGKRSVELV